LIKKISSTIISGKTEEKNERFKFESER